ncbi:lactadherin-like [Acanthaster planci]|uniref:Lactadherin-like n=1 Tax=Acanthaster planci TaxID=133434 RepID=A0A8B7XS75_ACAPL|nr:lactadherin-like [Acanthaster planci]
MRLLCTVFFFGLLVMASEVLETCAILTGQVPQVLSYSLDKLGVSLQMHKVVASSVQTSKMRCAATCMATASCTHFCYEPTTKRCLLENADSDIVSKSLENTGICYQTCSVKCSTPRPLGMEDYTITNAQISASSNYYTGCCHAHYARLNRLIRWSPLSGDSYPWIEVDLMERTVVSGASTQGSPFDYWYVKKYKVAYQRQPSSERVYVTDGKGHVATFTGNTNRHAPVTNLFDESVVATSVRIEPTSWNGWIGLRFELLGCPRD